MLTSKRSRDRRLLLIGFCVAVLCGGGVIGLGVSSLAQEATSPSADSGESDGTSGAGSSVESPPPRPEREGINLFTLLLAGGWFLLPILAVSILVITIVVERFIGLRRDRVMPQGLINALGQLGGPKGFDPRQAYRLCQKYPSAAANVIRAMLLKVGRPHSEVEHAVTEASEREANRMYGNVRWLTLSAAIAPLLGLLGTVWGMIEAFHVTTQLGADEDRATQLSQGIYQALVTTLVGLIVAIVAAIFAHWFEGRIHALFYQIDEMLFNLLPQIERYEGRVRFNRQAGEAEAAPPPAPPVEAAEV